MANNEEAMASSFARIARNTFKHHLILQRYPVSGEAQTNEWGLPVETPTDLQSVSDAIPCTYTVQSGREMVVGGQTRTVTLYKITIPRMYFVGTILTAVQFSSLYKVKLLPLGLAPINLDIMSGDPDPGPAIVFDAIKFEGQSR